METEKNMRGVMELRCQGEDCTKFLKKYMNNSGEKLFCWSVPLRVLIEKYKGIGFKIEVKGESFTIFDEYALPEKNKSYGEYKIVIATDGITDPSELNKRSITLQKLTEELTMMMKYATGAVLFSKTIGMDRHRRRLLLAGASTEGWNSNYKEVDRKLRTGKDLYLEIELEPSYAHVQLEESPLIALQTIFRKYFLLDENIRYLMNLNYEADMATPALRYMAYGKVLEIINVLYPLEGKTDKRIAQNFPELQEMYGEITIKRLFDWANNRAESRHYIAEKATGKPHPSFTYEELGTYGSLIDNLAINVIRRAVGLMPIVMVY